jgi:hypothetical protein
MHRPGGGDDPYSGWRGTSAHRGLDTIVVDGEVVPHGESMMLEAGEGEGLRVTVDGGVCVVETVPMTGAELREERERLMAEDEAFQEEQPHPVLG